eukprot:1385906-Amorphochlora_amoeboformis.AAC.2
MTGARGKKHATTFIGDEIQENWKEAFEALDDSDLAAEQPDKWPSIPAWAAQSNSRTRATPQVPLHQTPKTRSSTSSRRRGINRRAGGLEKGEVGALGVNSNGLLSWSRHQLKYFQVVFFSSPFCFPFPPLPFSPFLALLFFQENPTDGNNFEFPPMTPGVRR